MWEDCLKSDSFKIYWVISVWPKWQLIVPRETRNDFNIDIWDEFIIGILKEIAFWIWKSKNDLRNKDDFVEIWNVVIWTKYQFVIPCSIRNTLNISPWDYMVLIWKPWKWIWFAKNDNIDFLFDFIKEELNYQKIVKNNNK